MTHQTNPTTEVRMRGRLSGVLLFGLSKVMGRILAPGFHTMDGLLRAAKKNHAKGTARPPASLLRHVHFREESRDNGSAYHLSPAEGSATELQILYIHGGAWVMDMQSIQYGLVAGLLEHVRADLTMAIYPLAPEHHWAATMTFVMDLYQELAEKHGPANIVLTGDSAGGGIALLLAQALRDRGERQPAALVLYSPVLDLSATGADQPTLERRDPSVSISLIRNAGRLWAPDLDAKDPRISALFADQSGLAPTLVFTGDREVLDSDARRLAERNPGIDHRSYAEMAHVFPISGTKEGVHAMKETAGFIASHRQS